MFGQEAVKKIGRIPNEVYIEFDIDFVERIQKIILILKNEFDNINILKGFVFGNLLRYPMEIFTDAIDKIGDTDFSKKVRDIIRNI